MSANEPPKYKVGPQGGLRISDEWRRWRDANQEKVKKELTQTMSAGFQKHNRSKAPKARGSSKPNPEGHTPNWREVAYDAVSDKRIYFCACASATGMPFNGCGAVAVRQYRSGTLEVVVEPRFS